jgi:hypothetical protein
MGGRLFFIVTLLVRCVTNTFCALVPLQSSDCEVPSVPVSWNGSFDPTVDFGCQKVEEFISGIPFRRSKASLSVYYPSHAKFKGYDVILACWGDDGG